MLYCHNNSLVIVSGFFTKKIYTATEFTVFFTFKSHQYMRLALYIKSIYRSIGNFIHINKNSLIIDCPDYQFAILGKPILPESRRINSPALSVISIGSVIPTGNIVNGKIYVGFVVFIKPMGF